jgi:hypothetical protein
MSIHQGFHRRCDHYEGAVVNELMAAALFSGPSSVGVLFPEYFRPFRVTTVAYVFANTQFCIEEWSSGRYIPESLGAVNMLEKYEAHLFGLKEFCAMAPKRFQRLSNGWHKFGL